MLPNFIHIGAAKAASTWLWRICQEHPDIYVPANSDCVQFFCTHYHRGLNWYEKTYFADWNGEKAVGETSNSYMLDERAIERIAETLPGVKLTVCLRDPIEIAFLQYLTQKRSQRWTPEQWSFDNVLDNNRWQLFRMWIVPGLYHLHLTRILKYVPRERVLIMLYDDLVADATTFAARFFSFLDVDANFTPPSLHKVIGFPSPKRPDTPEGDLQGGFSERLREELQRIFREDVERLQGLIGRDLSHWLRWNPPQGP